MPSDRRSVVARGALWILILGSGDDRAPRARARGPGRPGGAGVRGCHGVPWCAPSLVGGTGLLWSWGLRQGGDCRLGLVVPEHRQPSVAADAVPAELDDLADAAAGDDGGLPADRDISPLSPDIPT